MTILDRILQTKRFEVDAAKKAQPRSELEAIISRIAPPRDFRAALRAPSPFGIHLIAEVKRASPSAGVIVDDFDPARIAQEYELAGASTLSVLTDKEYFQGQPEHIAAVKRVANLPVLRKDFIIDEYQVYESRAIGADAILLIMEAIGIDLVQQLHLRARDLGMGVLIEVHSLENLQKVVDRYGPPADDTYILGINNRDLTIQKTDVQHAVKLSRAIPSGNTIWIAESGIKNREDVLSVQQAGASAILVGESILREKNIRAKIAELLGQS